VAGDARRVAVPVHVHEAHAGLDQPAGDERALAEHITAVAVAQPRVLGGEVERHLELRRRQQAEGPLPGAVEVVRRRPGVGPAVGVVELLQQGAAGVEPVESQVRSEGGVGEVGRADPHRPPAGRGLRVQRRLVLAAQRVIALAQEAGPRPRPLDGKAPAEVVGHRDVMWLVDLRRLEVLAHGPHAGRVGVARDRLVDVHRLLAAGEARQGVVAAGLVVDRPHHGGLVHPLRRPRQVLADLDAGGTGGDRFELAADLDRGVRLEVEHVLRRGPTVQVEHNYTLGLARPRVRGPPTLQGEQRG